ncbi:MAG TPA: sugar phosphate isomerase/epimerase family protein [Chitinophagaceae bacterium]|nr:sugar phosphate isomerase/epimerase family protein [Chitinophagaceae bacterium]
MSKETVNRRNILKLFGLTAMAPLLPEWSEAARPVPTTAAALSFKYCLNMSTIRGHKLGFIKELQTASKAGFRAVEIWMNSLQTYLSGGGTIREAKKQIDDLGLTIENCIGFAEWIVDDDTKRSQGLELMKKEMDILAQIGCTRTAAPPMGATATAGLDLKKAAERYRAVLQLGDQTGVVPHLELWGFSKNLSRVSEVYYVALESGHPSAKVLLDVYHLYKGGSPLETLSLINPYSVDILHMNDYPAQLSSSVITDADRIYAGDGIAPIQKILKYLGKPDKPLVLSTEVFNKDYYAQDALVVAKTSLDKMKKVTKGL